MLIYIMFKHNFLSRTKQKIYFFFLFEHYANQLAS